MTTFYYKAYDSTGHKRVGTIKEYNVREAQLFLRGRGLKAYFLEDVKIVRKVIRKRRLRHRIIVIGGATAIALALVGSGVLVGYAGREAAPDAGQYREAGILKGDSGAVVAITPEAREFARKIYDVWQSFAPGVITGIEARKRFMTIYVNNDIRSMSSQDLEVLASRTCQALQRHFKSAGATLLIFHDDLPIMEVKYNGLTKTTKVKTYG